MAEKTPTPVVAESTSPAKVATVEKKTKTVKDHPSTAEMVNAAIKALSERNGSSVQKIKKYMASNYLIDLNKQAIFIKKYLNSAVTAGTLIQTKGKGASGSFKLPVEKKVAKPKTQKEKAPTKEDSSKKAKKSPKTKDDSEKPKAKKVEKKADGEKKATKAEKVVKSPVKAKSPSKAKKTTKGPVAKPKTPKPKKVTVSKTKPAKKAVAASN